MTPEQYQTHIRSLLKDLDHCLNEYACHFSTMNWRRKVLRLLEAGVTLKELGKLTDYSSAKCGARERIRLYLTAHVHTVIAAGELEIVSGISEYARRIRELRVEDGYKILTGHSNDPEMQIHLKPNEYLLIDSEPDHKAARRWKLANRIRRESESASRDKILKYMLENVEQVITTEELAYVSNNAKQYARRVRELRTEQGYPIATRLTGRPDLNMGEYILLSRERIAESHDRKIPHEVQKQVYHRDKNACLRCGWNIDNWTESDRRILELHHLHHHASGGANTANNLIVVCSKCHDAVHADRLPIPRRILNELDSE